MARTPGCVTAPQWRMMGAAIALELPFRPPYEWDEMLAFLARRAASGVDAVVEGRYVRTVAWGATTGWIAVGMGAGDRLSVEASGGLAGAAVPVADAVASAFDLAAEPRTIADRLGAVAARAPGLRVPGAFDAFELTVRAVLGQQVSVRAASTLAGRLAASYGEPVATPFAEVTRHTPAAAAIARLGVDDLVALGVTRARAATVLSVARAFDGGALVVEPADLAPSARGPTPRLVEPRAAIAALRALPGIGDWTAQYIAMRGLRWSDAFPASDLGIRRALGVDDPRRVAAIAEAWRPWRAYAAMHLWRSLGSPAPGPGPG